MWVLTIITTSEILFLDAIACTKGYDSAKIRLWLASLDILPHTMVFKSNDFQTDPIKFSGTDYPVRSPYSFKGQLLPQNMGDCNFQKICGAPYETYYPPFQFDEMKKQWEKLALDEKANRQIYRYICHPNNTV